VWSLTSGPEASQSIAVHGSIRVAGSAHDIALSEDGASIAYTTGGVNNPTISVISVGRLNAAPVPIVAADAWESPFFSHDGAWIGLYDLDSQSLMKVPASGGTAELVCQSDSVRGADWGEDDVIIFGTAGGGLWIVPADASKDPEQITTPEPGTTHAWPERLPNDQILFTILRSDGTAGVALLDSDRGDYNVLIDDATHPRYAPTGAIVYASFAGSALSSELYARAFDLTTGIVGRRAVIVQDDVNIKGSGAAGFDLASNGTLVYLTGVDGRKHPVLVDRDGREEPLAMEPREYMFPRFSPDGTRVAFEVWDRPHDIWILNLDDQEMVRTTDSPAADRTPVWVGDRLFFGSSREGRFRIHSKSPTARRDAEPVAWAGEGRLPISFAPDGSLIVDQLGAFDVLRVAPTELGGAGTRLVASARSGEVSPDGRWLAYASDDAGPWEVYVQRYPDGGDRVQVSTDSGRAPAWREDGRELYYFSQGQIMVVPIAPGSDFTPETPRVLLDGPYSSPFAVRNYDVDQHGQRFILLEQQRDNRRLETWQNWFVELERLMAMR
jgi:serine/threonine-protein kinase